MKSLRFSLLLILCVYRGLVKLTRYPQAFEREYYIRVQRTLSSYLLLRGENILHFCQNIPRALTLNKDCKGCQAPPLSIGPVMLETKPAPPRGDKTLHSSLSFKSILPFQIISSLESFQQVSSKSRLSLL